MFVKIQLLENHMNNPLRQYFRRPALHLSLPSRGKFYSENSLESSETGDFPVFPMTAIDEITSKTPDALFNGSAVADIIKSCIPAIKDPWGMPSIDIDAVLISIRAATNGTDLEINSECPSCKVNSLYNVNLMQLLSTIKAGDYDTPLAIGELKIKFRPLSYRDINKGNLAQFEMQREIAILESITDDEERNTKSTLAMRKISGMNMELIATTIESINLPNESVVNRDFINEFLAKCDRNTFESIKTHISNLREDSTTKPQKIKCVECSHEYEQALALNVSDFFV